MAGKKNSKSGKGNKKEKAAQRNQIQDMVVYDSDVAGENRRPAADEQEQGDHGKHTSGADRPRHRRRHSVDAENERRDLEDQRRAYNRRKYVAEGRRGQSTSSERRRDEDRYHRSYMWDERRRRGLEARDQEEAEEEGRAEPPRRATGDTYRHPSPFDMVPRGRRPPRLATPPPRQPERPRETPRRQEATPPPRQSERPRETSRRQEPASPRQRERTRETSHRHEATSPTLEPASPRRRVITTGRSAPQPQVYESNSYSYVEVPRRHRRDSGRREADRPDDERRRRR